VTAGATFVIAPTAHASPIEAVTSSNSTIRPGYAGIIAADQLARSPKAANGEPADPWNRVPTESTRSPIRATPEGTSLLAVEPGTTFSVHELARPLDRLMHRVDAAVTKMAARTTATL